MTPEGCLKEMDAKSKSIANLSAGNRIGESPPLPIPKAANLTSSGRVQQRAASLMALNSSHMDIDDPDDKSVLIVIDAFT